jgi:glutaryl-CoA dehydrogenase
MITEITKAQLLLEFGVLRNEGKATTAQISMAKRNNVDMAIHIAREARQILGAMGISGEYSSTHDESRIAITYEGTRYPLTNNGHHEFLLLNRKKHSI